ncbi:MAG: SDR family oxidoreductase [Dehalococcoidia bacterium]
MPSPSELNVEGKVFVAVGAGRGIGRGIVEVLTEAGAEGAAVALTPAYVEPMAKRVHERTGRRVIGLVADATDGQAMADVVARVLGEFGRIDIWINCTGDSIRAPLFPLPPDAAAPVLADAYYRHVLDVNLTTAVAGCRAIGPYFVTQRHGRVINISGLFVGKSGGPLAANSLGLEIYTAAKAGVEALTRNLAVAWGPYGVTVNCIRAGGFPDPEQLSEERLAGGREWASHAVPLGRMGELREVGLLVLYLAADAGAYLTGQVIDLDGGVTL